MHYIKDIFEGKETEHAHNKFIRYSKGNFVGPLLSVRFSKSQIKLSGSFHFVDEFLYFIADILENEEVHVKGSLVWNKDLTEELSSVGIKYSKVTKSRGIFKYVLDNDVKFRDFVEVLGKYNILLNIKRDDISIVTKNSFPKPNKEFGADFCKVAISSEFASKVFDEFLFDIENKNAKKVDVKHKIIVDDIIIPEIDNFEEARRLAKRVGKLERNVEVDGVKVIEKEVEINV